VSGTPAEPELVQLVSVNVSLPKFLGMHRGHPVTSGIAKVPVPADVGSINLDRLNLEGDGQADLEVHGGEDKAVYAYPSEHLVPWATELGQVLGPAAFGENLTTAGWLEEDVCIGDLWAWGDAVLEVCQPRWPCYKLGIHRGTQSILAKLRASGRTGWYLRVLQPGQVPIGGPILVADRHAAAISVFDVHEARLNGASDEQLDLMLDLEPLAAEWKYSLARHVRR
jgi:MOSC domain-containing protein YiiM